MIPTTDPTCRGSGRLETSDILSFSRLPNVLLTILESGTTAIFLSSLITRIEGNVPKADWLSADDSAVCTPNGRVLHGAFTGEIHMARKRFSSIQVQSSGAPVANPRRQESSACHSLGAAEKAGTSQTGSGDLGSFD